MKKCFSCGSKIKVGYRWYHGDQDDLICFDCARCTKHSDTSYQGQYVCNTVEGERC